MTLEAVLGHFEGVTRAKGGRYMARCPAHDDGKPSLSICEEGGKILVHCFADCPLERVLTMAKLQVSDLFLADRVPVAGKASNRIVAAYSYKDAFGHEVYRVERKEPKDFRQYRMVDNKRVNNLNGVSPILYRLPELIASGNEETVYVAEGEKDVEALRSAGCIATCNSGGAGKFRSEFAEFFMDRTVVIVQDKDDTGRQHARQVFDLIRPVVASVRLVEAREGKDAADHLAAGHTVDEFCEVDIFGDEEVTLAKSLAEIEPRETLWLWEPYIPRGELTILAGDGGVGKTFIGLALASALSRGEALPGGQSGNPCKTLYVTAEDDPSRTLRPRAEVLGANLHNIQTLDYGELCEQLDDWPSESLRVARLHQPALIVFDPLQSFMKAKTDMNSLADMRRELRQFQVIARETGAAVVVVCHLNKGAGAKANYRVNGSVDIVNAARSALIAGYVETDGVNRLVLAHCKANLGPTGGSWEYQLKQGRFAWIGPIDVDAGNVSRGESTASEKDRAAEWLMEVLAAGPVPSAQLAEAAKHEGVSSRTLTRAKGVVGAKSRRDGDAWVTYLPAALATDERLSA